ncbi:hypothetical protein GCM10010437_043690 [Actinoplanes palleronii]
MVRAVTAPGWAVAARDLALRTLAAPPGSDRCIRAGMCTLAGHRGVGGDQPAIIVLDVPRADAVFTPWPGVRRLRVCLLWLVAGGVRGVGGAAGDQPGGEG